MAGPIALVGSGEYLPIMADIEKQLISGRGNNYVQIPTAAAPEGERTLEYWRDLGIAQANRIGANAVPLLVRDHAEANSVEFVSQIKDAGLIYLSGGNPLYLTETLRDSKLWQAIYSAWQDGSSLAGCSAGAMAIADQIPDIKKLGRGVTPGLQILKNIRVLPHFDRPFMSAVEFWTHHKELTVLGIDENTALVGGLTEWEVQGHGTVSVFRNGNKEVYSVGQIVTLA